MFALVENTLKKKNDRAKVGKLYALLLLIDLVMSSMECERKSVLFYIVYVLIDFVLSLLLLILLSSIVL